MARIAAVKQSLEKALHDDNKLWTKYLAKIEKKIGVDRLYVFLSTNVRITLWTLCDNLCPNSIKYKPIIPDLCNDKL